VLRKNVTKALVKNDSDAKLVFVKNSSFSLQIQFVIEFGENLEVSIDTKVLKIRTFYKKFSSRNSWNFSLY
jgi:hypothetical protein